MNVTDIVKRMTLEEKVMQLCSLLAHDLLENGKPSPEKMKRRLSKGIGFIASLTRDLPPREGAEAVNEVQRYLRDRTRLGIPAVMHEECLHGNMAMGATVFPQSIGMAAAWDPALYAQVAAAIAAEARARGFTLALSPTINIARDPRCGRTEETYGEDVLLTQRMALAFIRDMQAHGVGCTAKHFAANFVGDGGRDSFDIHFSEREFREVYFPAFEACVRQAKVAAIMPAYNTLNGVPCSCDEWLLKRVLRDEWGFRGVTGSDYWAIDGMMKRQFVARDRAECARKALLGGMDVEWPNSSTYPELIREVRAGRVPMRALDGSVERVLRLKQRMGLFRNPFADVGKAVALSDCAPHRALSREAARKTLVLLQNRGLLPLRKSIRRLAVIGPNAATLRTGGYSSKRVPIVTPRKGLQNFLGKERVLHALGCTNKGGSEAGIARAVRVAKRADAVVLCVGHWSGGSWVKKPHTEGEGRDRCDLRLPGLQERLILETAKVNRNVVVVILGGSAVVMENWLDRVKAVVEAWYPGCEGGTALAEALFGVFSPGGKLPLTFPQNEGQLPCYYNVKPTGRHYDYEGLRGEQSRFPFGHGLSYTKFDYSGLAVARTRDGFTVRFTVRNAGGRAGDEVAQLYIHDKLSTLSRPLKELKDFRRVSLKPGRRTRVEFRLTRKDLSYLGPNLKPVFEPGEFEIMVGSSSTDIRLRATAKL